MALRDLGDRLPLLRRVWVDPPHRVVRRLITTGSRSGLLAAFTGHPLESMRVAVSRGLGVRSLHGLHAGAAPDRMAVCDARRTLDYRAIDAEIDLVAGVLRDHLGASRHAPVAVMMENRVEYVTVWFALFRLGITCAHVGRHSTAQELEFVLERSGARVVVASDQTIAAVEAVLERRGELDLRVLRAGRGPARPRVWSYDAAIARQRAAGVRLHVEKGPSDNVVYTSGTTGKPKGAVRDMGAMGATELLRVLERLPLHAGDRHLVCAPLYHSSGQVFALLNTALGSSLVLQEHFDAEDTLRTLSEQRIQNVFMVPTMIHRVLDLPDEVHARWPTPDLRVVISGAAPFNTALRERAIARFGAATVFDFYGATELGWVTLVDGAEMLARPGTLGRAIPGQEIGIFDDAGRRLPAGHTGRVYTRSAQLMLGYLRDRGATDETMLGDWVTVDDLGYLDHDGYLFLTGRARDMVISGGVNLYPVEIENALSQHPDIADVAVIGVPDVEWGERLVAVVVPRTDGFDAEAVRQWARGVLAPAKIPRQFACVDELPRNPTGKVVKRDLVARISGAPQP
ncbi:MAG: AMP-binding protein [Deltaproteobacteria bacterium]|nr:AMP-binding protein [Deltaproteobacteria bacterium]MBK8241251.1 AMP-binding protein [Deltaproteobacteria bacterium]MBK8716824.1 AMP-binding protein [Deltaproteobacteria bacterium]MBP7286931.1 AMP-binding protein [Nannocystaceae bacterium]